jgi:hypothetical protein
VSLAQWSGTTPSWSVWYQAPGACYGLGLDEVRQRLWVLTGSSSSNRELVCLDADPASPGYGGVLDTTALGPASRERWELSPSGNLAALPHVFLQSGLFQLVDLDPNSPTYLQAVVTTTVPGASGGFTFTSDCAISFDDQYAYVLYTGLGTGGLAVMHVPSQTWLDFDGAAGGQQDFVLPLLVGNRMDLSPLGDFLVLSGQGSGGWAARIDFDYGNPANTTWTQFLAGIGQLPNCNGASLSRDGTRVALTATPVNLSGPSYLAIVDVANGALLHYTTLTNAWNVYTTAWQDTSALGLHGSFGAGCAGSLGVPTLGAAPAVRPSFGSVFGQTLAGLPLGVGFVTLGLSNATSGGLPLPLDLSPFGLGGCSLWAEALSTHLVVGAGNAAVWSFVVPNDLGYLGLTFYNQGLVLDPAANAVGLVVSNATVSQIGY